MVTAIVAPTTAFIVVSIHVLFLQEYNICFTTVERSSEGVLSRLPSSRTPGVLPEV